MTVILSALVPIYFVLLLGFTAGKTGVMNNAHVGELNTVVTDYALPALLLAATAAAPRASMIAQWHLLIIFGVTMGLVYPLWYLIERRLLRRSVCETAIQSLTVTFPNLARAGVPMVTVLLGADRLFPVAVASALGSLLPLSITLALLEFSIGAVAVGDSAAVRVVHSIRRALLKPVVIAPTLGVSISLIGWHQPQVVTLSWLQIGEVAGGLALFETGLILSKQRLRVNRNVIMGRAMVTLVRPLLALGIALVLREPPDSLQISLLIAALPCGFFGILFGASYGLLSEDSGAIVIASTVICAATFAAIIAALYR